MTQKELSPAQQVNEIADRLDAAIRTMEADKEYLIQAKQKENEESLKSGEIRPNELEEYTDNQIEAISFLCDEYSKLEEEIQKYLKDIETNKNNISRPEDLYTYDKWVQMKEKIARMKSLKNQIKELKDGKQVKLKLQSRVKSSPISK